MATNSNQDNQNRGETRQRSPSLLKYRRVEKPKTQATPDDEIRVTGSGRVGKYVTYAAKLFKEQEKRALTIRATGKAVSIAVSVCEVVKRRFKGLHQVTAIGWTEIVDEYEPIEPGLEPRFEKRSVPSISIFLTFDEAAVDKNDVGYQVPLEESLVEERDATALTSSYPRPRNQGKRYQNKGEKGEEHQEQNKGNRNRRPNSRRRNPNRGTKNPNEKEGEQRPTVTKS